MTEQFLNEMYNKYLNRAPETEGFNYWKDKIDSGILSQSDVEKLISESPEALALQH